MKKRNNKHESRVKKLIVICALCGIILTVSTYAWFIGMKTVNVSSFDVKIAAIDSLSLSLDGITWSDTVEINEDNYNTVNTSNNTNSWGGDGLVPMSSVGKIDKTTSRLIMFEKGSFTETPGGYRIMASQVTNTTVGNPEQRGYVAFDLFIKNLSGNEYYPENNVLNEEAIYMTPESAVTVSSTGKANTGIENSVRVAFAQIGRVIATNTTQVQITGIDCNGAGDIDSDVVTDPSIVTSICDRDATIWEPNDTKHVDNAINWYNESCKKRTAADLTLESSYSAEACSTVEDGTFVPTYAVSGVIDYSDQVDLYDGTEYNGYTTSIAQTATTGKLYAYDTFTDTEKMYEGTKRPEFISLAPNSITKVRVYIYLEGQDVDNYDFASLGRSITVAFGLTKERFYGEDVDYDGDPELPDDVTRVRKYTLSPEEQGEITTVEEESLPKGVTYDDGSHTFSIPRWITSFTFKVNTDVDKTLTFVPDKNDNSEDGAGTWTLS